MGFVGRDSEGLEGFELQYNDYIRGETGSSVAERDALGRRVLVQGVEGLQIPPGSDIHLTLDTSIQHMAEKELEATITNTAPKRGTRSSSIRSPAKCWPWRIIHPSIPTIFPNSAEQRRNRAVTDSFEPGSTFKTILAAAALEEGVVGKDDLFYCEMGKYPYAGKVIHDTHPQGWLPFLKNSPGVEQHRIHQGSGEAQEGSVFQIHRKIRLRSDDRHRCARRGSRTAA